MKSKIFHFPLLIITAFFLLSSAPLSYEKERAVLATSRTELLAKWKQTNDSLIKHSYIKQAANIVEASLVSKLIPFWYGTEWDFNGYSAIPGEGKIACGYFVSTLMQHAGFNLNRYKMAQKHSLAEVTLYSCGSRVDDYRNMAAAEFIKIFKLKMNDGLYVVGLDNHIGFLYKENGIVYFIHSNYRNPSVVVKELAEESLALNDSRRFVITAITGNKILMQRWIENERIGD